MTVRELIQKLEEMPQDAVVRMNIAPKVYNHPIIEVVQGTFSVVLEA